MTVADDIKSRLDIVEVVSGYVALQKAGRNYKAICPYHSEKTPSFVVNPERQTWRCFGACATGGDLIGFVMRSERLEFKDAIRLLADKAGIDLARRRGGDQSEAAHRLNRLAASFYQEALDSPEGRQAKQYLAKRGLDKAIVEDFELGYSPAAGDRLRNHLQSLEAGVELAVEVGLLRRTDEGGLRDFFWGRLMFPIHDRQGRVSGFGARAMDGSMPKYLNTSRTPVFDKSSTAYGLHRAVASIREQRTAIIVEGYMDAIAAHQHGHTNVVASMGTALTEQQVGRLKSLATTFVLALDPDVAGQEATLRSLDSSWRVLDRQQVAPGSRSVGPLFQIEQPKLKIASLPSGVDPDELIRRDLGEWERLVGEATPYKDYVIEAVASRFDLSAPDGRAQAAQAVAPLVTGAGDPIEQEHYFRKLTDVLGVSAEALEASIGRPRPPARPNRRRSNPQPDRPRRSGLADGDTDPVEEFLLALLLGRPELRERVSGLEPERLTKTEDRELFTRWQSCSTIEELEEDLDDALQERLQYLLQTHFAPTDRQEAEAALDQCVQRLEERYLREHQEGLLLSVDSSGTPPPQLQEAVVAVNDRLKDLFARRG